jgi:hypothetical protein
MGDNDDDGGRRLEKETKTVRRRFARQESSDEEDMNDDEICIQYNPDLLPPVKIDLDEIDYFLAHDIFVQESLTSTK